MVVMQEKYKTSPEKRVGKKNTIKIRDIGGSFSKCEEEMNNIYRKISALLYSAELSIENLSPNEDRAKLIGLFEKCIHDMIMEARNDMQELITKYDISDADDIEELEDIIVQLEERETEVFTDELI